MKNCCKVSNQHTFKSIYWSLHLYKAADRNFLKDKHYQHLVLDTMYLNYLHKSNDLSLLLEFKQVFFFFSCLNLIL